MKVFNLMYPAYKYPFINADLKLAQKTEIQRRNYYRNVYETLYDDFGEMKGYMKDEIEEMIRYFYQFSAQNTTDISELTAYRITLIFIKKFESRLQYLASKYKEK